MRICSSGSHFHNRGLQVSGGGRDRLEAVASTRPLQLMRRLSKAVPIGSREFFLEGRDPVGQFLNEPIDQRGEIRVSAKTGVKLRGPALGRMLSSATPFH